ncbi:hypothetical protein [Halorubrum halodurans]|uniref:Uncharacterized protein n=1 Tax=Halorubrum halodurans TaxID=1383851 RepID=A0A256IS58_9EURY|nr:hypothetical protein [Halorubrum halodurans]OYR59126.1 hypothetical protein DJ70_01360 [Halorubrum halodurans]
MSSGADPPRRRHRQDGPRVGTDERRPVARLRPPDRRRSGRRPTDRRRGGTDPNHGARGSAGTPKRWARTLSIAAPAGAVAVVGLRLGSIGRRRGPRLAADLAGLPVGVDGGVLSTLAGGIHAASLLLGLLVACAVGWLVVSAAVRIAAIGLH